jgi:hypothetical protein
MAGLFLIPDYRARTLLCLIDISEGFEGTLTFTR